MQNKHIAHQVSHRSSNPAILRYTIYQYRIINMSGPSSPLSTSAVPAQPKPMSSFNLRHDKLPIRRGLNCDSGKYGYPRTLYVCLLVPQPKNLSCPPYYEYSIIGDAIPSNEGLTHHFLRCQSDKDGKIIPGRYKYECLKLDTVGPG